MSGSGNVTDEVKRDAVAQITGRAIPPPISGTRKGCSGR